jgi:hypothetical protein
VTTKLEGRIGIVPPLIVILYALLTSYLTGVNEYFLQNIHVVVADLIVKLAHYTKAEMLEKRSTLNIVFPDGALK